MTETASMEGVARSTSKAGLRERPLGDLPRESARELGHLLRRHRLDGSVQEHDVGVEASKHLFLGGLLGVQ